MMKCASIGVIYMFLACIYSEASPTRITNLVVDYSTAGTITFSWTEPTPTSGHTLVSNDVRISTSPITTLNFYKATNISALIGDPGNPGTFQTVTINGLSPGTTYFVAIKSVDTSGGWSIVSNVPRGITQLNNMRATLVWDAPVGGTDVTGYKVYRSLVAGTYTASDATDAGLNTTLTYTNLEAGVTYFFVATAYADTGLESDYSNEVQYTVPTE